MVFFTEKFAKNYLLSTLEANINSRTHASRRRARQAIINKLSDCEHLTDNEFIEFIKEQRNKIIQADKWSFRRFRHSNFLAITQEFLHQAEFIMQSKRDLNVPVLATYTLKSCERDLKFNDYSPLDGFIDKVNDPTSSSEDILLAAKAYQTKVNNTWFKFRKYSKSVFDKISAFIKLAEFTINFSVSLPERKLESDPIETKLHVVDRVTFKTANAKSSTYVNDLLILQENRKAIKEQEAKEKQVAKEQQEAEILRLTEFDSQPKNFYFAKLNKERIKLQSEITHFLWDSHPVNVLWAEHLERAKQHVDDLSLISATLGGYLGKYNDKIPHELRNAYKKIVTDKAYIDYLKRRESLAESNVNLADSNVELLDSKVELLDSKVELPDSMVELPDAKVNLEDDQPDASKEPVSLTMSCS